MYKFPIAIAKAKGATVNQFYSSSLTLQNDIVEPIAQHLAGFITLQLLCSYCMVTIYVYSYSFIATKQNIASYIVCKH